MNRLEYKQARSLIRQNGLAALKWLPPEHERVMRRVAGHRSAEDLLHSRASVVAYFRRIGAVYTFRQLANATPLYCRLAR